MRISICLTAALGMIATVACNNEMHSPMTRDSALTGGPRLILTPGLREVSPAEDSLIQEIVAMYPGPSGERLGRHLRSTTHLILRMGDPAAQALLNQIDSIRHARSALTARKPSEILWVTVARVSHLDDPAATAVLLRRPDETPSNILLVPPGATPGQVEAGVRAAVRMRKTDIGAGNVEQRVVIHGGSVSRAWAEGGEARHTEYDLNALPTRPFQTIRGIGRVRTFEMAVAISPHSGPDTAPER